MPTPGGSWQGFRHTWSTLRRWFRPADLPEGETQRRREGGLHGFYRWAREQVLDARRHNEELMQDERRNVRRAQRRALTLLMRLQSPEQREEFRMTRQFHVIGGKTGTRYRIRAATLVNIDVLDNDGTVMHRLCAHPTGDVPLYDVLAAQMLYLQDPVAELRFLQQAYVHSALPDSRVRAGNLWSA